MMASTPNLLDDEHEALGQSLAADAALADAPELTLDPSLLAQIAPTKIVEPCPKCGAAMPDEPMPWCRACGFYPKFGTYFDPDESTDVEQIAKPAHEIPPWAYVLVGGLVFILIASLAVRFTTHPLSPLRFYWAIGQMAFGATVFIAAHLLCFMFASTQDATVGLMDPILRPINVWKPSIFALPKTFRRVATGTWGLGAVFCALLIGGIPWEKLTDWGDPAPRRKTSLVSAITSLAREEADAGADNLEDAVKDFAGEAGDVKAETEEKRDPTKRSHEAECVIVGYIPSTVDPTDFVSVLVATDLKGKLKIVAQVSDGIPDKVRESLRKEFQELKRERPFIPSQVNAIWVQPKLFCRIGFNDYSSSSRMKEPLFRDMLLTPSAAQ